MKKTVISRRDFIKNAGIAAAGFTVVPRHVLGGKGYIAPSDKLNIASVGIGGTGGGNTRRVSKSENIVALCDVDWDYVAKKFKDFRKMLDEMDREIDAVIVGTPDHTHAIVTSHAMKAGKHVYVQKPLTHSVYESRYLTRLVAQQA